MEIENAFKLKGFDQLDLLQIRSGSRTFSIRDNKIKDLSKNSSSGIGVRAIVKGRVGYSYTNSLEDLEKAIKTAIQLSRFSDKNLKLQFYKDYPNPKGLFDKKIVNTSDEEILSLLKQSIDTAQKNKCIIMQEDVGLSKNEIRYMNSEGVDVCEAGTHQSYEMYTNYGGSNGTWYEQSRSFLSDFTEMTKKACDMARLASIKKKVPSGIFPVIFHPLSFYEVIEMGLIPSFCADNVQQGQSKLKGQIGKKIFDTNLTVHDSGILDSGLSSGRFDSEGVPCQNTSLVENGIVRNFLYDLISAQKDGKKSTGNGAGGYSSPQFIGASNVVFKPGVKDVLSQVDKGFMLYEPLNAHCINGTSGDFSLGSANGFWIEKGELKFAPKQIMISGNMFEFLKKIELGKDVMQMEFEYTPGAYVGPSVLGNCRITGS